MLIKGNDLNTKQRNEVLSAFGYRWTVENESRARQWFGKIECPLANPETDAYWLESHAFHFTKDGNRLMANRRHAEPVCFADWN